MSDFESFDRAVVEPLMAEYNGDEPKLVAGMKNFIAFAVGQGTGVGAAGSGSGSEVNTAVAAAMPAVDMPTALRTAKLVLAAVNTVAASLDPVDTWAAAHPQGADQSSVERLDEVLRYKVVRSMCSSSAGKGVSVCKVLGRLLLRDPQWPRLALWPQVEALVEAQLCPQGGGGGSDCEGSHAAEVTAEAEAGRAFLRRFGETLFATQGCGNQTNVGRVEKTDRCGGGGVEDSAADEAGEELGGDEEKEKQLAARLVWSGDFNGELSRLRARRQKQALERLQRQQQTDAYMADMRDALRRAGDGDGDGGDHQNEHVPPRVEELN